MVLKSSYKRGFLKSVTNTKGKKARLVIVQRLTGPRGKGGFVAVYGKTGRFKQSAGKNPEKTAKKLAKSGHSSVSFMD